MSGTLFPFSAIITLQDLQQNKESHLLRKPAGVGHVFREAADRHGRDDKEVLCFEIVSPRQGSRSFRLIHRFLFGKAVISFKDLPEVEALPDRASRLKFLATYKLRAGERVMTSNNGSAPSYLYSPQGDGGWWKPIPPRTTIVDPDDGKILFIISGKGRPKLGKDRTLWGTYRREVSPI